MILRFSLLLFILLFQVSLSGAQPGGTLQSAAAKSVPTIDGKIGSSEWSDATRVNKTLDLYTFQGQKKESHPMTLYVKNDGTNLYIAGRLEQEEHDGTMSGSDINSLVMDTFNLAFDNNNDGNLQPGEDKKSLSILNRTPYVKDEHRLSPAEQEQGKDESEEPQNMKGQIIHSGEQYQFELSIPLSSGDSHDVQLQPGGKVRWNLFYFDKFNFTMQGILFGGWDGLDVESSQNWGYLQLAGSGGSSSSSSAAPVPAPTIPPTPSNAPPSQDIQTFARLANESDLSPDRIQFLGSHFDMILNSFPFREKITQLKKVNPQLKVLLFTNPYFSWGDEFWNKSQSEIQASQQKYSLKTTDNKTILYSGPTYGGMDFEQRIPLMDVTNSKWQNYYSSQVKKYVQYGKLDGLFIDTMGEDIPPWALAPGHRFPKGYSATNWKNQNHAFLKKVKQAFSGTGAMIVFNGISRPPGSNGQIPNRGMLNQVDGTFIEAYSVYMPMDKNDQTKRWYFEQTILKDMKTISEQGKVVLVEVYGDRADEQTRLYALTSYLLIQNKKTYFSFTKMDEAGGNRWYPEWGVRLGKPRGTYQVAGGAYSRDYDNGKVLVNPSNKSVAVPLTRSYKDWKGNQIGNVLNIPAFGGALLINN